MGRFIIARASFGDLHNMYKAEGGEEERQTEQLSRLVFLSGHTMTFRMRCSLRLSFHVLRALCRPFYSILLFQGVLLLFLKETSLYDSIQANSAASSSKFRIISATSTSLYVVYFSSITNSVTFAPICNL